MPVHLLSDVDVVAVSIVEKGANRKRIFLRKQEDDWQIFDLPSSNRLIKATDDDWSVFYAVVAEPGSPESPGKGASQPDVDDLWADDTEIQKAAWRFMQNGGLVNRMHETLSPYGQVVENYVTPVDLKINNESIKKGSWVIGIMPTEEGRQKIENGEFTGVSIQGTGTRTLDKGDPKGAQGPKAKKCPSCGGTVHSARSTCQNCGHKFSISKVAGPSGTDISRNQGKQSGPLKNLIAFYMKKPHPFRSCVRDNRKRFGNRAERVCAALKDIGMQTTHWRKGNKKIAKSLDEDWDTWDSKSLRFVDELCDLWIDKGLDEDDATLALEAIKDQEAKEQRLSRRMLRSIAKAVGVEELDHDCDCDGECEECREATLSKTEEETDMSEAKATNDRVEKLETEVNALNAVLKPLSERLTKVLDEAEKPKEPTPEDLQKTLDDVSEKLDKVATHVDTLSKGDSTQPKTGDSKIEKTEGHVLAGLLLD